MGCVNESTDNKTQEHKVCVVECLEPLSPHEGEGTDRYDAERAPCHNTDLVSSVLKCILGCTGCQPWAGNCCKVNCRVRDSRQSSPPMVHKESRRRDPSHDRKDVVSCSHQKTETTVSNGQPSEEIKIRRIHSVVPSPDIIPSPEYV
jgi:hypothetical protein